MPNSRVFEASANNAYESRQDPIVSLAPQKNSSQNLRKAST